ncbi:MAG: CAAX farnesyltransferase (FTase) subunit beta [Peltula sp. TS41687]|nr:MAG: CAAX farnesyltransferase (FTase) subunit beta [Peltula sp. TS41687]
MPLPVKQNRIGRRVSVRYRGRQLTQSHKRRHPDSQRPTPELNYHDYSQSSKRPDEARPFRQGAAGMLADPISSTPTALRHLTLEPPIRDALKTETSEAQDETLRACLPLLAGEASASAVPATRVDAGPLPGLQRQKHVAFLRGSLGNLPAGFVAADASRPWMLYWALVGLYLLGEDVSEYRERYEKYPWACLLQRGSQEHQTWEPFWRTVDKANDRHVRVVSTLAPMQSPDGGFGGGHGQLAHCAASYAAILSLIVVGGDDSLKIIDRRALYGDGLDDSSNQMEDFLFALGVKRMSGALNVGPHFDGLLTALSGAYCALVMISLLNLPLELPPESPARTTHEDTFLTGLPEYLSRCQTFEGGISGAPDTEAHGAYAFCALACLCIMGDPREMLNEFVFPPDDFFSSC